MAINKNHIRFLDEEGEDIATLALDEDTKIAEIVKELDDYRVGDLRTEALVSWLVVNEDGLPRGRLLRTDIPSDANTTERVCYLAVQPEGIFVTVIDTGTDEQVYSGPAADFTG